MSDCTALLDANVLYPAPVRIDIPADQLPKDLTVQAPGETITVSADTALPARDDGNLACLVRVVAPTEDLHAPGVDGWSASEIDRTSADGHYPSDHFPVEAVVEWKD